MNLKAFLFSSSALFGAFLPVASTAHAQSGSDLSLGASLAPEDLAIVLPANARRNETLFADASLAPLIPVFDKAWISTVNSAFEATSVGRAPILENEIGDWRLVSFRVVPCSPLANHLAVDPDLWCWPEIRLVWQPVVEHSVIARTTPHYADDRAVHALYDIDSDILADTSRVIRARDLLAKVRVGLSGVSRKPNLTNAETTEFLALRNEVSRAFLSDAKGLRGSRSAGDYKLIDTRAEYFDATSTATFRLKMIAFLSKHAPTKRLRDLTAFSLPEGRDPPLLDEWVFLSFGASGGQLVRKDITLDSSRDGRVLFNYGSSMMGSQRQDDPSIYNAFDSGQLSARDRAEIEASVFLIAKPGTELRSAVSDRSKLLVPNTSCASCHKMNDDTFQFHNLSYLEDRSVSVSPRVERDVALDLAWARAHL